MDVSDVLRDRMHEPGGASQMAAVSVSAAAHASLIALLVLSPGSWFSSAEPDMRNVMTINLIGGGPRGADTGGFTPAPGRAIQEVAAAKEPPRAPAAKPEMALPSKRSKPAPAVKQSPNEAKGSAASKGSEVSPGAAVAETGIRGQGFGLSTSSAGSAGGGVQLDVPNFCCPEYIATMTQIIREAWIRNVEFRGKTVIRFVIQRNGTIGRDATIFQGSGYTSLDNNALRAVLTSRALPPLPAEFPNPTLGVRLTFEY
jgi:TonB family protein